MRTNAQIAAVFTELAERLAVVETQPYRWLAYQKAAAAIRDAPVAVARLAADGRTREVPGIGKAIAEKIDALLATETFPALERARREVPDGLLALTQVEGIGARTAQRVWRELDASSWEDVLEAARVGRLGQVSGIGPKTVRAVLEHADAGAAHAAGAPQGLLRNDAVGLCEAVLHLLQDALGSRVQDTLVTGELTRGVELPRAASLVLVGDDPHELLLDACAALRDHGFADPDGDAGVPDDEGAAALPHALLLAANGAPVVLWASDTAQLPRTCLHAVGPAEHAAELLGSEQLLEAGAAATPPGGWAQIRVLEGEPLPDAALYAAAGRTYTAPELRDGLAGSSVASSELVRASQLVAELHCHSTWSDGRASILDMARAARDRGDTHIVIADHSAPYAMVNGLDGERLEQQAGEIALANGELGGEFTVLQGSEVEVQPDGSLGLPDEVLERLDWVVASLHVSQRQDAATIWARMERVLRNPLVDCIGHPSSRILHRRAPTALDLDRLTELAAETGTILEINADPRRLDLDAIHATGAIAAGVRLAINSDAHSARGLAVRDHGVAVARRAGARPADIVNTLTVEQLQAIRPRNRSRVAG